MLYIAINCICCRFFCLLTIKIFFPKRRRIFNTILCYLKCVRNNYVVYMYIRSLYKFVCIINYTFKLKSSRTS